MSPEVVPPHIAARRAARRAQIRRRRRFAWGTLALLLTAVVAALVISSGGGSSSTTRVAAAKSSASSTTPPHRSTTGSSLESRGLRNIERLARLGKPIYCAGHRGNAVAFTFDDGPGPYTHYALKKLAQWNERATFFVVGRSMNFFPGWLPHELKFGAIGDHTYTHPFLTQLSPPEIYSQLSETKNMIERDSGETVTLFRPPYGDRNSIVDGIAKELGLLEIIWTVDSRDSLGANWAAIIKNVEAGLHPGSIILMHENRGQTIRALTTILPYLHRRHLRSVSLPELFATDPPSIHQVMEGLAGCGIGSAPKGGS